MVVALARAGFIALHFGLEIFGSAGSAPLDAAQPDGTPFRAANVSAVAA